MITGFGGFLAVAGGLWLLAGATLAIASARESTSHHPGQHLVIVLAGPAAIILLIIDGIFGADAS